jgi:hypothetical protein
MYELSAIQVAPDSFQVVTAKDPCKYEVNNGVPDSIHATTAKESSNEEVDNSDSSGDPYQCDTMPSSSDEDEIESITYLKRKTDHSSNYWNGVSFHAPEKALDNALIRAENYYTGHKMMYIHVQRSKIHKMAIFKRLNLAHLKYLQSKNNPKFECSTDEESKDSPLLANPNAYSSSFSEDEEDMLMIKSLDYKLCDAFD